MTCERISQDSEATSIIKQSFVDSFTLLSFFPLGLCLRHLSYLVTSYSASAARGNCGIILAS